MSHSITLPIRLAKGFVVEVNTTTDYVADCTTMATCARIINNDHTDDSERDACVAIRHAAHESVKPDRSKRAALVRLASRGLLGKR